MNRIRQTGTYYAQEAKARGIEVLLAPVIDLSSAENGGVIGDRAFSIHSEKAWAFAKCFVEGILAGGGLPVVKHFPGHGGTSEDSHIQLARLNLGGETLKANLAPFKMAAESQLPAIMVGHIACAALDPEHPDRPASMSHAMVTGILREAWGYPGFIIADDLNMKSVTGNLASAALKSIRAGCDAVIICDGNEDILRGLVKAIDDESKKDPQFLHLLLQSKQRLEVFRSRLMTDQLPPEAQQDSQSKAINGEPVILVTHKVRKNDTLSKLAIIYGVTSKAIQHVNNKSDDTLYIGEVIKIPE